MIIILVILRVMTTVQKSKKRSRTLVASIISFPCFFLYCDSCMVDNLERGALVTLFSSWSKSCSCQEGLNPTV